MIDVLECCRVAKENSYYLQSLTTAQKNEMLTIAANAIIVNSDKIIAANAIDLANNSDKPPHILDRLTLNKDRIVAMADGLRKLVLLDDPIGETIDKWRMDSGAEISKVRVPLGVIAIIYEARPNVTIDAIGLCVKTANSIVLRGSKDAIESNKALVDVVKASILAGGLLPDFIQLVEDTTHAGAETLMKCRQYVDVLLPRGSAALIRSVVEKSTIPVIETGSGNCHAYIEKSANYDMALNIILNGKLQRPSVCNALESLLIDEDIAAEFLPKLLGTLRDKGVTIYGCEKAKAICQFITLATEEDYYTEYLDLKISIKVVSGVDEAIAHINKYGTKHSEVIITSDMEKAQKFLNMVDSAAVYVNASTRFTDGFQFGFGAEMGISTQKLHARGPLGLKQLTSEKYQIIGDGQTRK